MPLFAAGFRPFFLAASAAASVLIPIWLAFLNGKTQLPGPDPIQWHGHEMVFGFGLAMVAGFLTTAVPKWTSTTPLTQAPLMILCALWLAGRLGVQWAGLAFLPLMIILLAIPLLQSRKARTLIFIPILLCLWACELAWHLQYAPVRAQRVGVGLFVLLIAVIGGRVLPFFTRSALVGTQPRVWKVVEWISLATAVALPVLEILGPEGPLPAIVFGIAAVFHAIRLCGWFKSGVLKVPLLWSLYAGYGWLVAGFALKAAGQTSLALHAFTVGAMGGMGMAIMGRASLGHSGRPLKAAPTTALAFLLVNGAALARVTEQLSLAGALWTLAFGLFTLTYLPIWLRPRADGKPG